MKKIFLLCFLVFCTACFSFAQIYKGEGTTKNGTVNFSLHYIDLTGYRCLFFIDGVSIFMDEDNIIRLEAILEKFAEWEAMAEAENISLTKTIDSITFTGFHHSYTFFREPLIIYFVFSSGAGISENAGESGSGRYTLFIDTTMEKIVPFRLSSQTAEEMRLALSPEKLSEAWDAYEKQRALEEMFK